MMNVSSRKRQFNFPCPESTHFKVDKIVEETKLGKAEVAIQALEEYCDRYFSKKTVRKELKKISKRNRRRSLIEEEADELGVAPWRHRQAVKGV